MSAFPPTRSVDRGHHQRLAFTDACGMEGVLRLIVRRLDTGELTRHDLSAPYALIGRDPACQIHLADPAVSRQHAYIQLLQGRLYCFDLGSRTGIRFRDGARIEGVLNGSDSLFIGPFQIRLSQAPAYRLHDTNGGPDFENQNSEDAYLAFRNAGGRSSRNGIRQLRRKVTLLGRCARCHVKLSDDSVGRVHATIVRTPVGHWFVNLRPDKSSAVQGDVALCEPLADDYRLEIGLFRMKFCIGAASAINDTPATDLQRLPQVRAGVARGEQVPASTGNSVRKSRRKRERRSTDLSEHVLLTALEQFGQMQEQLLSQSHQQSLMLARVIAGMQQEQHAAIHEQIMRIQAVTDELMRLQHPRLELNSEVSSNISKAGEVSQESDDVEVHAEPVSHDIRAEDQTRHVNNRQGRRSASARNPKDAPDRTEAYQRVTRRIHELERERTKGWQKVMSLLGVRDHEN